MLLQKYLVNNGYTASPWVLDTHRVTESDKWERLSHTRSERQRKKKADYRTSITGRTWPWMCYTHLFQPVVINEYKRSRKATLMLHYPPHVTCYTTCLTWHVTLPASRDMLHYLPAMVCWLAAHGTACQGPIPSGNSQYYYTGSLYLSG